MITRPIFRASFTYRSFSSHARSSTTIPAALHLKTGQSFTGCSFGAPRSIFGETVFSTSITSCTCFFFFFLSFLFSYAVLDTESMTDPSYRGQILVFTTPLIGNYGVPHNIAPRDSRDVGVALESSGVQCAGVVVADVAEKFSHYTAIEFLHTWCSPYNVPG